MSIKVTRQYGYYGQGSRYASGYCMLEKGDVGSILDRVWKLKYSTLSVMFGH